MVPPSTCRHLARRGTVSARMRLAPGPSQLTFRTMTTNDLSYHEARAEEELALAQTATSPGAVRAHVALAEMHLDIVYQPVAPAAAGQADGKPDPLIGA